MAAPRLDDLSAPSDFGAASAPRTPPPPSQAPDDDTSTPGKVSPDHVHYHADEQRCDMCSNFGRGNQCSYLGIQVEPEGGCIGFKDASGATDDTDADTDAGAGPGMSTDDDYGL